MAILWCGGEELDFPSRNAAATTVAGGTFRAGYGRAAMAIQAAGYVYSPPITPRTSLWVGVRASQSNVAVSEALIEVGDSGGGTPAIARGRLRVKPTTGNFVALVKYSGAAETTLATSTLTAGAALKHVVLQVENYGAAGTARVWVDGALFIEYTGDLAAGGSTALDFVGAQRPAAGTLNVSEMIVADEDVRTFSLVTLAPSGAGDANAWTGAYTDVDEAVVSDADVMSTETPDAQALLALSDRPAGSFSVKAVKIVARAAKGVSGPGTLKLGIKSGGTVDVDAGQALATSFETKERILATNPVTSAAFTTAEIDALQLALEAAA